jgi:DNA-binding IclR family transcriptional regulator
MEYLASHPRGARLVDIATAVDMDTGQTHRILSAMAADGWVMSVSDNGSYSLTARAIGIVAAYIEQLDLVDHAQPFMDELFRQTGESVFLGEFRSDAVVCVGRRLSDRTLTVWTDVGKSWPLVGTAVGTAILSAKVSRLGSDAVAEMTADITDALKRRYARDFGHYRTGVQSVAAPILDASGEEVGTISVAGPETRMTDEKIRTTGSLVREAAERISERIGCRNYSFSRTNDVNKRRRASRTQETVDVPPPAKRRARSSAV